MPRVAYSLIYVLLAIEMYTAMDACSGPDAYKCIYSNEPSNCNGSLLVKTNKNSDEYQLSLCHDNHCTSGELTFKFRCCQICEACISLDPQDCRRTANMNMQSNCEEKVDAYLNSYCLGLAVFSDLTPTRVSITPSPALRSDVMSTTRSTPSTGSDYTITSTPTCSTEEQSGDTYDVDRILVITLAGLLGLCVLLLCITCSCWIRTCRVKSKVLQMDRRPVTYRALSGSRYESESTNHTDNATMEIEHRAPAPRYDEVTMEENREGFYHVLESRDTNVAGTDVDRENSLHDGYVRDSEFPSTSFGESFYHVLESGQDISQDSEFPEAKYDAVNLFDREDYDVLKRGQTSSFDDVMSAVLEVSSRAGTLLPTRYNTVADIHMHDNGNYDVLDRRDNERGNEEQQDRNPFTNEAQSREINFTRQDPSLHDDDDYDSLESIHENNNDEDTYVEVTSSEKLPQETTEVVINARNGMAKYNSEDCDEDYDVLASYSEQDIQNDNN